MCQREVRIEIDRLPEALPCLRYGCQATAVEENSPLQVELVRVDVGGGGFDQRLVRTPCQGQFQTIRNGCCDLILNRKHVRQLSLVSFRPQVVPIRRVHQLYGDP